MLNPRAMQDRAKIPAQGDVVSHAGKSGSGTTSSILVRLVRDYLRGQWVTLAFALLAMLVTSAMTMALAYIVQPAIRELFLNKNGQLLWIIPLAAGGILIVRAASFFAQPKLVGSLGERIVAAAQR